MLPVLFSFGQIAISTFGFFAAFSFVAASFFLWRTLRDDYPEEEILSLTILLTLGAILGARIVFLLSSWEILFQPTAWFNFRAFGGFSPLGAILAAFLLVSFWTKKKSWDFWQIADVLVSAFLAVLVLLGVGLALSADGKFILSFLFLSCFSLILSFVLVKNYRKFIWYKSGKPGFSACLSLAFFFAGWSLLEFVFAKSVYWEKVIVLVFAIACLVFLYRRSERNFKEDLLVLRKKK